MAIIFILLLLLDWYAFQGVKTLLSGWDANAPLAVAVRWAFWLTSILLPASIVAVMLSIGERPAMRSVLMVLGSVYLTLTLTKFIFSVPLLLEDITRLAQGGMALLNGKESAGAFMPERRKFVSQMAVGLAAIPFTSFMYGIFKGKYDYTVRRHTLFFPDLPKAFDGFTITQISDVHSGSFDNFAAVRRGVNLIRDQKSDVFVFTGDLVNSVSSEFEPYLDLFGSIKAPHGQFSILGNHDYGDYASWPDEASKKENLEQLFRYHKEAGYRLLLDEHVKIERDGEAINLIGVQNWGKGFHQYGDLEKALSGVHAGGFNILLSHDPSHWEFQVKNNPKHVHLTMSGHTHGMQMGVEIPGFKWSPIKYRYPKWAGMYHENGKYLHINRGFGFLGFSGRVGILPEITVVELRRNELT